MSWRKFIFSLFFLLAISGQSSAFWVWTPETNKWVNPKFSVKDTPQEQLDFALEFFQAEDYPKAVNEFEKLIKYYPRAREAAEAQYHIGLRFETQNQLYDAVKAYQKVIEKYPFSDRPEEIIEREYNIGEQMLEGQDQRNAFIEAIVGSEYPVVEIFRAVIKNAPYGKFAAAAQYKIGR